MDESKVTDGKAVLVATLGSRGLPTEDRIRAAVDAAEAERSECALMKVTIDKRLRTIYLINTLTRANPHLSFDERAR